MRRYSSPYASSFSFGPGPISTALKALIGANVAAFVLQLLFPVVTDRFGLIPIFVVRSLWLWQLVTYMFLHGGIGHLLINMLVLWMVGAELEHVWGTRYFVKFYFVAGVGAAVLTVLFALMPFEVARSLFRTNIIGASGAIYGLLLAYAIYYPNRPIYLYFLFPIPARIFVMIIGALAFYSSFAESGSGVASATHLGGLLVAYVYLKGARLHPMAEVKYRYVKWKMNRVRKKFDVYSGGRADDWNRRVH